MKRTAGGYPLGTSPLCTECGKPVKLRNNQRNLESAAGAKSPYDPSQSSAMENE